jgi:hypothetical protein
MPTMSQAVQQVLGDPPLPFDKRWRYQSRHNHELIDRASPLLSPRAGSDALGGTSLRPVLTPHPRSQQVAQAPIATSGPLAILRSTSRLAARSLPASNRAYGGHGQEDHVATYRGSALANTSLRKYLLRLLAVDKSTFLPNNSESRPSRSMNPNNPGVRSGVNSTNKSISLLAGSKSSLSTDPKIDSRATPNSRQRLATFSRSTVTSSRSML